VRAEQAAGSPLGVAAVTGSSGLVGTAVAATLHAAGFAVRGVDRAAGRWTSIVGDLRDPRVRQAALRRCAVLVHAAALHAPHVGHVDEAEFHAVNVAASWPPSGSSRRAGSPR
jgi:nucleoside-diphosphate-sugar epimerase